MMKKVVNKNLNLEWMKKENLKCLIVKVEKVNKNLQVTLISITIKMIKKQTKQA